MGTSTVIDNQGSAVAIDSLAKTYSYNGPGGAIDTITATDPVSGATWVQTLSYSGSNVATQSIWVRQ